MDCLSLFYMKETRHGKRLVEGEGRLPDLPEKL